MTYVIAQRPEWSVNLIYRPHFDLAVKILDEALEERDAAKIRSLDHAHQSLRSPSSDFLDYALSARHVWLAQLRTAYQLDENRLRLHHLILTSQTLSGLIDGLSDNSPESRLLSAQLCEALRAALTKEAEVFLESNEGAVKDLDQFEATWRKRYFAQNKVDQLSLDLLMPTKASSLLLRDLQRCRRALFNGSPPPITLLHAPALKSSGRSTTLPTGERLIAVSFSEAAEWVFCQALHEEVHGVTDRQYAQRSPSTSDTRRGEAGHAIHQLKEKQAVDAASALIRRHCPQRVEQDLAWRRAHNLTSPITPVIEFKEMSQTRFAALTEGRQRLILFFISLTVMSWLVGWVNALLGGLLASLSVLLLITLCYVPSALSFNWIARLSVRFEIQQLNGQQRAALVLSSIVQLASIIALYE